MQRARRLVVRGAARRDEASRSLDRLLERCRDRVSAGAPQQVHDTSSATTLLTRVTRIFQKSVFTEATPAARTGHPAGLFAARTHIAAAAMRQRMQTAGCRKRPAIVSGLLFTMKIPT